MQSNLTIAFPSGPKLILLVMVLQVLCAHPAALCELYVPLGKPLIVLFTTRPDLGRTHDIESLHRWRDVLRAIAQQRNTAVLANSVYDSAYADYFAGLQNVPVVPSLCRSAGVAWSWRPIHAGGDSGPGPPFLLDVCDDTRCPPFRQVAGQSRIISIRLTKITMVDASYT